MYRLFDEYKVPFLFNKSLVLKYRTQIADYYRQLLYAEVTMNQKKINYLENNKPLLHQGQLTMKETKYYTRSENVKENENNNDDINNTKNVFKSFFFNLGEKISNMEKKITEGNNQNNFTQKILKSAETISNKLSQIQLKPFVESVGNSAAKMVKKTDNFVSQKRDYINNISSKIFQDFNKQNNPSLNERSNENNNIEQFDDANNNNTINQDAAAPIDPSQQKMFIDNNNNNNSNNIINSNQISIENNDNNEQPQNFLITRDLDSEEDKIITSNPNMGDYFIDINQL